MDFFVSTAVIDTIRFWYLGRKKMRAHRWTTFHHRSRKKGIRIFVHGDGKVFIQCSLPRLHFGHNGQLLVSQADVDAAMNKLMTWLEQGLTKASEITFSRIDLCWHFAGDPKFYIASLGGCSHPQIQGLPAVKPEESTWWGKMGSVRRICGYDKEKEQNRRPGNTMRFEVSLIKHALRKELTDGAPVCRLDFLTCYSAYRRILIRFNPPPRALHKPGSGHTKRLIAEMEMKGLNVLEDYMGKYKNKQSANRARKEFRAIKLTMKAIDFNKLLPESAPPEPIHVQPKKRCKPSKKTN